MQNMRVEDIKGRQSSPISDFEDLRISKSDNKVLLLTLKVSKADNKVENQNLDEFTHF